MGCAGLLTQLSSTEHFRTHTHAHARTDERTHARTHGHTRAHMWVPSISTRILVISSMIEGLLQNHQHPYLPTRPIPLGPIPLDRIHWQAATKQHPAHAQVPWPSLRQQS